MTSFTDLFPEYTILNILGDDLTYTRGATTYTVKGVSDDESMGSDNEGDFQTDKTRFSILKTDLPITPQRGDTITANGETYRVDRTITNNDNYYLILTL